MFQKKLSWIIGLLLDQRGEDDPAAGAAVADPNADPGTGDPNADPNAGGDPNVDPNADPNADPNVDPNAGAKVGKFGEFGDDPVKLFQAYQGIKSKTTATERNLATLRKNLESAGLKIGEDGTIQLGDNASNGSKKKRFTEEHAKLFDQPVLQAMQGLIEDYIEDHFGKYEQRNTMKQQYISTKKASNSKMVKMFPGLLKEVGEGEANSEYNEAFYNRATEIWSTNPGYKSHPSGELFAAMEAAIEMGISPIAIAKAKAAGYKAGVGAKKVLGPAGGSGSSAQGNAGFKRLSVAEFRLLTPDKKEEYQQQLIKQSK
jgi:hypothetical protein